MVVISADSESVATALQYRVPNHVVLKHRIGLALHQPKIRIRFVDLEVYFR